MTENKGYIPNSSTSADLMQSWHIPRPTLARSSNSSQGSTSGSTNSTQSARSGSLLLTAANLAHIHKATQQSPGMAGTSPSTRNENIKYYLESTGSLDASREAALKLPTADECKKVDADAASIASSMHFTVVNVNSRPQVRTRSFCKKHQLSVLVVTMSAIFTIGIITAVFLLEMRAKRMSY
ncbi:uncharacterized protein [Atheta coriaria]|uniref:uncharacterized protein n=1 Tax=Dalotia coriaria TaxID=877792 RepID=UPI0031F45CFE